MACYKPIQVHQIKKGQKVIFKSYKREDLNVMRYDMNVNYLKNDSVPCRKCIGCKMDNAKEWAIRSALESKESPWNWFVTLTYSNENLTYNSLGLPNTNMNDLTKFINSLRKYFERKGHIGIKYIASNEYGSKNNRPHYHILLFNCPLDDLVETGKKNSIGNKYYQSKLIDKLWNKGMTVIGYLTYESAGYTARYSVKKMSTLDYKTLKLVPEKLRMSKGIAKAYYERNKDKIYKYDVIYIKTEKGLLKSQPPRYFDRLAENDVTVPLEMIKLRRSAVAKNKLKNEVDSTVSYVELLADKQRRLSKNAKSLKRNVKNSK